MELSNQLKTKGIIVFIIFIISNIIYSKYYYDNLIKLNNGTYNYDGFRYGIYVIPLIILLLILFGQSFKLNSIKYYILISLILHLLALGLGIERIPILGLVTSLISITLGFIGLYKLKNYPS